jgi:3'(2'), 5'-bisphosphate nucleotidase
VKEFTLDKKRVLFNASFSSKMEGAILFFFAPNCMTEFYESELRTAIEAVAQACDLAKKMQGKLEALDVVGKEDFSPVTITDFSCQALINMHLHSHFPEDPIMGEEDALFLRQPQNEKIKEKVIEQIERIYPEIHEQEILDAIDFGGWGGGAEGRFWVLDPIDGTRGFIRNEQYAVALGLIVKGQVVLGVLGCPRLHQKGAENGGIFTAVRGQGTELRCFGSQEKKKIQVNRQPDHQEIIFCEPHESSKSHSHLIAFQIAQALRQNSRPFRLDSQCKYAMVALGEASIYLRIPVTEIHREKIWDHAAGMLIVEEAGGKVTDLLGKPLDYTLGKTLSSNKGLIASNGVYHDEVVQAAARFLS